MNTEIILRSKGLYDDVLSVVFDFLYGTKQQVRDEYVYRVVDAIESGHNLESAEVKDWEFTSHVHAMMARDQHVYDLEYLYTPWCECCISFKLITGNNIYYQLRLNKMERALTQLLKVFPVLFDKNFDKRDIQRLVKVLGARMLPIKSHGDSWICCGECSNLFHENIQPKDVNVTPHSMKNFYLMLCDRNKVNRFYIPDYKPYEKVFDQLPRFPCLEIQELFYENMKVLEGCATD